MKQRAAQLFSWLVGMVLTGAAVLADDALVKGFITPPESAKPYTWWHWMDGQVTREGITLDLEDMKRVGLGGLHLFDGGLDTPATIKLFDALSARSTPTTAVFEAARGKVFRLVFPKLAAPVRLAEVTLHGEALVNGWNGKAGFRLVTDFRNTPALAVPDTAVLQTNAVIDLTANLRGETLTWDVPEGDWVILRSVTRRQASATGRRPKGPADWNATSWIAKLCALTTRRSSSP